MQKIAASLLCLFLLLPRAGAADWLLTADLSEIPPVCDTCAANRRVGLAKLATQLQQQGATPRLDAGNALGNPGEAGLRHARAIARLGLAALNIGFRDFRAGGDALLEQVAEAGLPAVSANLVSAQTGALLFPARFELRAGEQPLTVIGLAEEPRSRNRLPHLRRQLEGVRFLDPAETLRKQLGEIPGTDPVVVLYYGGRAGLDTLIPLLDADPRLWIAAAGLRPDEAPPHARLLVAPPAGTALAQLRAGTATVLPADPKLPDSPAILELFDTAAAEKATAEPSSATLQGENRGALLRVRSFRFAEEIDGLPAPDEMQWLLVDAQFQNHLAFELVLELGYQERILLGPLSRQLFLLHNGRRVLPVAHPLSRFVGAFPDSFILPHNGASLDGLLVFAVPKTEPLQLSLHYYHDLFAPLHVDLRTGPPQTEPNLHAAAVSPDQLRAGVLTFGKHDMPPPREGLTAYQVELLGQGLRSGPVDELALRPGVPPGSKVKQPRVTDYLKADDLLYLLVDGLDAYPRDPALSTLAPEPTFLPDRLTGGTASFWIPSDAQRVELALDFPSYRGAPGAEDPESLRFLLQGDPAVSVLAEPRARLPDHPLPLSLHGITRRPHPDNEDFTQVLLEMTVRNLSEEGGMYEPRQRFRLETRDGQELAASAIELRGGQPAPESIWLSPDGETRRFWLVFDLPLGDAEVRLNYGGGTQATELDLAATDTPRIPPDPSSTEPREPTLPPPTGDIQTVRIPFTSTGTPTPFPARPPPALGKTFSFDVLSWPTPEDGNAENPPPAGGNPLTAALQRPDLELQADRMLFLQQLSDWDFEESEILIGVHLRVRRPESHPTPEQLRWIHASDIYLQVNQRLSIRALRIRHKSSLSENIRLAQPGDTEEGFVFFSVPTRDIDSLTLHIQDKDRGPFVLPLHAAPAPTPFLQKQNRFVEIGLYGLETPAAYKGADPGNGRFLVLDLRGRSLLKNPDSPTPDLPFEWRDGLTHIQLQVQSQGVYQLYDAGDPSLSDFTFLPGTLGGGRIAFDLPLDVLEQASRVELLLGFHPAALPGDSVQVPETLVFPLKDQPFQPPQEQPLHTFTDLHLRLDLLELTRPGTVDETAPARNMHWFTARFQVTATHPAGIMFMPNDAVQLVGESRRPFSARHTQWVHSLIHRPNSNPIWIPQGASRTFLLAWHVPQTQALQLRYEGVLTYDGFPIPLPFAPGSLPPPENGVSEQGIAVALPGLEPKGIAGVGLTPEQVNHAIDRGEAFLWETLKSNMDGRGNVSPRRENLLMMLALTHTKAHQRIPEFNTLLRKTLTRVRSQNNNIYENAIVIMILDSLGEPALLPMAEQFTRYIVETQREGGSWSYSDPVSREFYTPETDAAEPEQTGPLRIEGGAARPEPSPVAATAITRTQPPIPGKGGDLSCTQFAILGLWSAQRMGLKIDDQVWWSTLSLMSQNQNPSGNGASFGGFGYNNYPSTPSGSMTAAGICTLALGLNHFDPERPPLESMRILNALGWVVPQISFSENPRTKRYNYYYLYSIERVGQILGTEFLGPHEWYPLGAKHLVGVQTASGAWPAGPGENEVLTTCYALLFLTRATPTLHDEPPPPPQGPGTLVTEYQPANKAANLYLIFDASGSMRAPLDGQSKFEVARDAVRELIAGLPDDARVALRVYGHRRNALQPDANEDTELVIPPGPLDREQWTRVLTRLRPVGRTPLALSLEQAIQDTASENETLLVLLTDGGDDTSKNPGEVAARIAERPGTSLYVVGFDINRPDWTRQLEEMAAAAGGTYLSVNRAAELSRDLQSTLSPPPPAFTLINAEGETVAESHFGAEPLSLEPGTYRFKSSDGTEIELHIRPLETVRLTILES